MKKWCWVFGLIWLVMPTRAQVNNSAVFNRIRPADSLVKQLHLNFYNFNYVRNYEYTNNFHDGYTMYGTQLEPQLVYYVQPHLVITAGAYLRKDFGDEQVLYDAKPLFNIKYSKNDLTLIFGSIEGNIQHDYIEPIYDYERKITTPIEYGTQLLINKDKIKLDTWIAWQKMIYRASPYKEEFMGGANADVKLAGSDKWRLSWPVQFLASHLGGQIDTLRKVPVSSLFNGATGFKLQAKLGKNIHGVFTENHIAFYKDFSRDKLRTYNNGIGIWLNAGVNSKWGSIMASYWYGDKFITLKGMQLYQSVSESLFQAGYAQAKRNVITLRYLYQKELLPSLFLDVRLEPSFDLDNPSRTPQFNHSFFLTYKGDFRFF